MTAGGFLTAFFALILLVVIFAVVSVVGTVASISGAIATILNNTDEENGDY